VLLLGGQLGFELLDPRLKCGNHIVHRLAAGGPYRERFVLQLVKINRWGNRPVSLSIAEN
jgi:hypothetical protein